MVVETPNNLGAARLQSPTGTDLNLQNTVKCVPLDELHFKGAISFFKIDVEGMELEVLAGAEQIISRWRPTIAVEVIKYNENKFWTWLNQHNYVVIDIFVYYIDVKNYIIIPVS